MRKIFTVLLMSFIAFSFIMTDAQAKRFGGGKSFGMSRSASTFSRPSTAAVNPASRFEAPKPASTASKWLGPLAGFAAGGLLASLFMGHGGGIMGGGIFSWLLIGGLIFFALRFMSRMLSNNPSAQSANLQTQAANSTYQPVTMPFNNTFNQTSTPIQFDEAAFLRQAKALFIRLQAAYDTKNLADLREFTSPEIYAEIQLQLHERGSDGNQTDVVTIDAELLDVTNEAGTTIASTQFTGLVREQAGAEPVNVKEIWHFRKNEMQSTWVVAGIQQS
jgi:predicted lipid-binding transport protein (Tim44 family)